MRVSNEGLCITWYQLFPDPSSPLHFRVDGGHLAVEELLHRVKSSGIGRRNNPGKVEQHREGGRTQGKRRNSTGKKACDQEEVNLKHSLRNLEISRHSRQLRQICLIGFTGIMRRTHDSGVARTVAVHDATAVAPCARQEFIIRFSFSRFEAKRGQFFRAPQLFAGEQLACSMHLALFLPRTPRKNRCTQVAARCLVLIQLKNFLRCLTPR